MKHIVLLTLLLVLFAASGAYAEMLDGADVGDDHTAREEAAGKAVWEKLRAGTASCANLSKNDFGALGEYFMGQMLGDVHSAMNTMMERMMGEEGEERVHVVMGKRLSGCDSEAAFSPTGRGFMPMMSMFMGGGWGGWPGGMMGWGGGAAWPFWVTTLLVWIFLALGIIALWRWIKRQR